MSVLQHKYRIHVAIQTARLWFIQKTTTKIYQQISVFTMWGFQNMISNPDYLLIREIRVMSVVVHVNLEKLLYLVYKYDIQISKVTAYCHPEKSIVTRGVSLSPWSCALHFTCGAGSIPTPLALIPSLYIYDGWVRCVRHYVGAFSAWIDGIVVPYLFY